MKKEIIRHDAMPPPYAAYSQAVRAGDLLFVSGQAGIVPETGQVAGTGFEAQARQAFANLRTVLDCSGCRMEDVVKVTTWLGDSEERASLNDIFAEHFPTDPPARSTPIVALPMGLLLSVEAIAVLPRT